MDYAIFAYLSSLDVNKTVISVLQNFGVLCDMIAKVLLKAPSLLIYVYFGVISQDKVYFGACFKTSK